VVDGLAVALAGHLRLAVGQQIDITCEDDGSGFIDTAVALRQGGFGLSGDLGDGLTPGPIGRVG
jgi:hypothetical protein